MVCWNQNKASKSEPKLNTRRKKQEQSYLFVWQILSIGIFNWLLFILPRSKPAIFIQHSLGFLYQFYATGEYLLMKASQKSFLCNCTFSEAVGSSSSAFACSHTHIFLFVCSVLSLAVWPVSYVSAFMFSASVCSSLVGHFSPPELHSHHCYHLYFHYRKWKVCPFTSIFNPVCAKRGWGLF